MFYYLVVFVLVFYLPVATLGIDCMECSQHFQLNSPELLNTTRPECAKTHKPGDFCQAQLIIYFEYQNASAYLTPLPEQALIFSNGRKIMTNVINLWFGKNIALQLVTSMGFDNEAIAEDINKVYSAMRTFKHQELRTNLNEHLYTDNLNNPNLVCSDNNGKTVDCPNGFCQLIGNITSPIDQRCVPQGKGTNPSGIQIQLSNIEGLANTTAITYACNKPMCNGADTYIKVLQLLNKFGVFEKQELASSPNSAMTIMNFQWVLLLIMTSLFKI